MTSLLWSCGRFELDLRQTRIMGIVNVTPDSFSDGGRHDTADLAIAHAHRLVAEGAEILDIGGESTRPGAPAVSVADECARILPVIEGLRDVGVPLSIDTFKPEVMTAVLDAGADIINDIRGFDTPQALTAIARFPRAGLIAMHMQGEPQTMQEAPQYSDVVDEVCQYLLRQASRLQALGFGPQNVLLDPGLGFGKTTEHNLALLRAIPQMRASGYGVLIGGSRKSMLGALTGRPVGERLPASLALALYSAHQGAGVVRVHDVAATRDALTIWQALEYTHDHP